MLDAVAPSIFNLCFLFCTDSSFTSLVFCHPCHSLFSDDGACIHVGAETHLLSTCSCHMQHL